MIIQTWILVFAFYTFHGSTVLVQDISGQDECLKLADSLKKDGAQFTSCYPVKKLQR